MSGDDTPKKKKSRLLSRILLLVTFTGLAVFVVLLITGTGSCSSRFTGFFSPRLPVITVNEFNFDIGRDRVFAHMESSVAAAGTLGIQVLDDRGRETLRDPFRMIRPAIISSGGRCIAFDIGGSAVRVFDASHVSSSIESDGRIVSASINKNGWFCIVTQESGGTKGVVNVHNGIGLDVYRVSLGSGYVLSAVLSDDNKNLAVLNLTDTGSRITFYHGIDTEEEPANVFDLSGGLLLDIMYLPNGDILAVSTDSLFIVESSGGSRELYSFSDNRLGGYTHSDDFIALHLYDYGLGHSGRLVTLLADGTVLGEMVTDREVVSMSAVGKTLAVLKSDDFMFFSDELEEYPVSADNLSAAGAGHVLAVSEDAAVATSDNSAVVLRREEER